MWAEWRLQIWNTASVAAEEILIPEKGPSENKWEYNLHLKGRKHDSRLHIKPLG
jgi:hypothetical protein